MTSKGVRLLQVVMVMLAFGVALSCGNDNSDPGAPPVFQGLTANFTANDPSPDDSTITLQLNPNTAGDVLVLDVVVTAINYIYGATFSLSYDPAVLSLVSIDPTESFLIPAGGDVSDLEVIFNANGQNITVTRIGGDVDGVTMNPTAQGTLARLAMRTLRATSGEAIDISDFSVTVCAPLVNCIHDLPGVEVDGGVAVAN